MTRAATKKAVYDERPTCSECMAVMTLVRVTPNDVNEQWLYRCPCCARERIITVEGLV